MANIQFLKGSQSNLDKIVKYTAGSFYLTEDSEKLYYAETENNLINLSKQCIVVESSSDLPTWNGTDSPPWEGDIYYVKDGNMLVTYNSTSSTSKWTQINPPAEPDTDTLISVDSIDIKKDNTATDKIKFKLELKHKAVNKDGSAYAKEMPEDPTAEFEITQDDFNAIIDGAEVGLAASNNTISTTGTGADIGSEEKPKQVVTFAGGGSVEVATGDNNTITITGAKYALNSSELTDDDANGVRVALTEGGEEVGIINLIASNDNDNIELIFEQAENSEPQTENTESQTKIPESFVRFKHKSYKDGEGNDIVPTLEEKDKVSLNPSGKFEIISNITVDNGHITSIGKKEFTLPEDENDTIEAIEYCFGKYDSENLDLTNAKESENLTIRISDTSGQAVEKAIPLYYTVGETNTVIPMLSNLSDHFYDKDEIDDKILGLNGVTYRGVLDDPTCELIISGKKEVSHGDMYLAEGIIFITDKNGVEIVSAKEGDLLIFRSLDEKEVNGYIEKDKIIVDVIPSGNETDTTYAFSLEKQKIDESSEDTIPAFTVKPKGQDKGTVFFVPDGELISTDIDGNKLIIDHAKPTGYKAPNLEGTVAVGGGERTFTAIQSVVRDDYGHITDFTSSTYTLPDDNDTTYKFSVVKDDNKITLAEYDGDSPSGGTSGSFEINGENKISVSLTPAADNDTINGIFTVSHDTTTVTNDKKSVSESTEIPKLNLNSTFIDVENIGYDDYGHINAINYKKYSLKDLQHNLDLEAKNETVNGASTKKVVTTLSLKDNDDGQIGDSVTLNLQSETLQLEAEGSNTLKVDLVWGTF